MNNIHRTPGGKTIRDDLKATLAKASGDVPSIGGVPITQLIASGSLTRENSCDGKVAFSRYERAAEVAKAKGEEFGITQYAYPCPFCGRFHLATERGRT